MSHEQEQLHGAYHHKDDDYFSRPLKRQTPSTGDLIAFESDEEVQNNDDSEALSPVQSDLLTPATLSPSVESTERSPLLGATTLPNHGSFSAPIVCCRAGARPADIPFTNNTNPSLFPAGPPQNMGGQPMHYGTQREPDLERNKVATAYRPQRRRRCCSSKYLHRWIMALGLTAGLLALQHFFSTDTSPGHGRICSLPYCADNATHSFIDIESFSLTEDLRTQGLSVQGTVWLEPAHEDQKADVSLAVSYASSTDNIMTKPQWELTGSSVRLLPPAILSKRSRLANIFGSCLSIGATIYLKPNVTIQSLSIDTTHLSIVSSPELFTPNTQQNPTIALTTLTATSSPIHLPHWTSRKTTLRTSSSAITGTFTLLELLSLQSQSGSITATISPGEADPAHPAPAELSISSSSGRVRTTYPPASGGALSLPSREYRTSVNTMSGSIKGTYLLGASASLTTSSGLIEADILPFDSQTKASSLRTSSSSGAATITVLRSYRNDGKPFTGLRSVHESEGSGSIRLLYPADWEGTIAATTESGRVSVKGRGVVVDEAGEYVTRVVAHKGEDGGCSIEARTSSASIDVLIGGV